MKPEPVPSPAIAVRMTGIAKRFGKGVGFGLGLTFPVTSFFFRTALAYDKSTYDPQP